MFLFSVHERLTRTYMNEYDDNIVNNVDAHMHVHGNENKKTLMLYQTVTRQEQCTLRHDGILV